MYVYMHKRDLRCVAITCTCIQVTNVTKESVRYKFALLSRYIVIHSTNNSDNTCMPLVHVKREIYTVFCMSSNYNCNKTEISKTSTGL